MVVNIESCLEGAEKAEGIVVLIDVFRASNTVIACLANGAECLIPVADLEEAYRMKEDHPEYLLFGERDGNPLPRFDAGNSPAEALEINLKDKKIIISTSGGSKGLVRIKKATRILVGSFANIQALIRCIKSENPKKVTLVPIGSEAVQPATEDEECAKYIKKVLLDEPVDFERVKMNILASGRSDYLVHLGYGADLEFALKLNRYNIVPEYDRKKGIITDCLKKSNISFREVTATEMQNFERAVCKNFDIKIEDMMEKAGKAVFDMAMNEIIKPEIEKSGSRFRVLVVSGKGNNGGDALVAARLLHEKGIDTTILSPYQKEKFTVEAMRHMEKAIWIGIPVFRTQEELKKETSDLILASSEPLFNLIIDGLFGFSLKGSPHPPADKIIKWINNSGIPVLSVDVPSGLEAESGRIMEPAVKADYTLALAVPKAGLEIHREYTGRLFLGNPGIPERAYRELGYYSPIFLGKSYISLD